MDSVYSVRFSVDDVKPVGKARPRFTRSGHCYTPKTTVDFERLVRREYIKAAGDKKFEGAVAVYITARFEPPKSLSMRKRETLLGCNYYTKKADVDNIAKAVLDGLNGVAFKDDAQVAVLGAQKRYAERCGVSVYIESLYTRSE